MNSYDDYINEVKRNKEKKFVTEVDPKDLTEDQIERLNKGEEIYIEGSKEMEDLTLKEAPRSFHMPNLENEKNRLEAERQRDEIIERYEPMEPKVVYEEVDGKYLTEDQIERLNKGEEIYIEGSKEKEDLTLKEAPRSFEMPNLENEKNRLEAERQRDEIIERYEPMEPKVVYEEVTSYDENLIHKEVDPKYLTEDQIKRLNKGEEIYIEGSKEMEQVNTYLEKASEYHEGMDNTFDEFKKEDDLDKSRTI